MSPVPTAGQTVGPFFGFALPFPHDNELVVPGSAGAMTLHGVVLDGAGDPVPDAILELWQSDAGGDVVQQQGSLRREQNPSVFTGFGRASTDVDGRYAFTTVVPGYVIFVMVFCGADLKSFVGEATVSAGAVTGVPFSPDIGIAITHGAALTAAPGTTAEQSIGVQVR